MAKENAQPITGCGIGDVAPFVFLCGDPGRVPRISKGWNSVKEVCRVREYLIHTGIFEDVPLTVASTGIGGPSTAVVLEEVVKLGAHTLIRVGNSGALSDIVQLGDYVITTGSIRDEGTSRSYVRTDYPAVAHHEIVQALIQSAAESNAVVHTGITWSIDAFYARNKVLAGDGRLESMSVNGFTQQGMNEMMRDCKRAGVLNLEMESSTILTLANLFGVRAGCICTVSDRAPWPGPGQDSLALDKNMTGLIDVANQAMLRLAKASP